MKPLFGILKANHMGRTVMPTQVYEKIGHKPDMALDPAWANTCAIRMSFALVVAGMKIRTGPARLRVAAGPFKGEQLEPSQKRLSEFLVHEIGRPEKFKSGTEAQNAVAWRRGIISFFQLHGTNQGHIDLVSVSDWHEVMCNGSCYWDSHQVWFWPLK